MKVCPKCDRKTFFDDMKYCNACGSVLVKKKELKCSRCRERISEFDVYCSCCGNKIKTKK